MTRRALLVAFALLGIAPASFGQFGLEPILEAVSDVDEALRQAVQVGDGKRVELMLTAGANVNTAYENGFRLIYLTSDPKMVDILLKHGAKLRFDGLDDDPGVSAIDHAAENYAHLDEHREAHDNDEVENRKAIVGKLRAAGGEYTVYTAICMNDIRCVEQKLAYDDAWVNRRSFGETAPLRLAARYGRTEICRRLLDHKADPDCFQEGCGYPILMEALDHPDIVMLLITHNANLRRRVTWRGGRSGYWPIGDEATLLHHAVSRGNLATIKLLVAAGLDPNAADELGQTPLHIATKMDAPIEVMEFLLDSEASLELTDKQGRTPFAWAEKLTESREKLKLLERTQKERAAEHRIFRGC